MKLNKHTLATRAHYPTGFHEEFFDIFQKSPEEISAESMQIVPGKIDATYLAQLLFSGNISAFKALATMPLELTDDVKNFDKTLKNIFRYISDAEMSADEVRKSEKKYPEILDFVVQKFPKSRILQNTISQKIKNTISQ